MSGDRVLTDFVQTGAAMKALGFVRSQPILGAVMAMLIIPMVLAAFVPVLAPIPEASAVWTAPPLPDRDQPLGDFQHLLEPLPIVVRDLPDAESKKVVTIYETILVTDSQSARMMLDGAKAAIAVPPHFADTWSAWLESPTSFSIPLELSEWLAQDPRNGDRISNLAVAMYFSIFTQADGTLMIGDVISNSLTLLSYAIDMFPDSRSPLLNFVFIDSVTWGDITDLDRRTKLYEWIEQHPDDATALQLAVGLFVDQGDTKDIAHREFLLSSSTLFTLTDDPSSVAFGHAMIGDVYVGNLKLYYAIPLQQVSPFTVEQSLRHALRAYDTALEYSDDPSIYAARAVVLSLLGDLTGAIASQQRAVELSPESMTLRLRLADLLIRKSGAPEEVRASFEQARELERDVVTSALNNEVPALQDIQITAMGKPTYLVSGRSHRLDLGFWPGMAGGGYVIAFSEIPTQPWFPSERIGSTPVESSARNLRYKSEVLGDPEGAAADIDLYYAFYEKDNWPVASRNPDTLQESIDREKEQSLATARLVDQRIEPSTDDLANYVSVSNAMQWLRVLGDFDASIDLCRTARAVAVKAGDSTSHTGCDAMSLFLSGDYDAAMLVYHEEGDFLRAGYIAEYSGDRARAERYYREGMNRETFDGYGSMLRLAGVLLWRGNHEGAEELYSEWLEWANAGACAEGWCMSTENVYGYAHSNRGIARLQMSADRNGNIDCNDGDHDACIAAAQDFDAALDYDTYNPVFLMNRAWVARLMGDHELSTQLMSRALESDASLYPVLTDMGVYAFDSGDSISAREFFQDAVAANPEYDLGWWNLGVLEMRKGPSGILRGQAYLARALVRNPSLATSSLNFKTDESIYRVEITEQISPGAGWSFATASSLATTALGFLAAAFIVFQATTHVLKDKLVEYATTRLDSAKPWLDEHVRPRLTWIQQHSEATWILLALTIVVMVFAAIVPAWRGDPGAASATIALALFALALAVVTHEFGHRLSASLMKAELEPVQWAPGIGLSLFLLPFNLSSGPFPAQRVKSADDTTTLWVYLFGPLANLGVALSMYTVYLMQPLPVLRMIAITQLAVMSYALLPFEPLDGAPLSKAQPKLVAGIASFALLAGVLFSVGII